MLDAYSGTRTHRRRRAIEYHAQRPDIDARSRRRSDRQKLHLLGIVDLERQRLVLVVDVGADRFEAETAGETTT